MRSACRGNYGDTFLRASRPSIVVVPIASMVRFAIADSLFINRRDRAPAPMALRRSSPSLCERLTRTIALAICTVSHASCEIGYLKRASLRRRLDRRCAKSRSAARLNDASTMNQTIDDVRSDGTVVRQDTLGTRTVQSYR